MKGKKGIILFLTFIVLCIFFQINSVSAKESKTKTRSLEVYGNVNYKIRKDGNNNSDYVKKVLSNYPINLYCKYRSGKTSKQNLYTDDNGNFNIVMITESDIDRMWVEIRSDNEACYVFRNLTLTSNFYPYIFNSKDFKVPSKRNSIYMNIKIDNKYAKGAINIARVINNAHRNVKERFGIDPKKILVRWTFGKGDNSQTDSYMDTGMTLSGKDHDERDESVICHEYGHWVYGNLRNSGKFKGGNHSSQNEIGKNLAYSEGLATFFGQLILDSEQYIDGHTNSYLTYSIEDTPNYTKVKHKDENEHYISCMLWDIVDKFSFKETWDNLAEASKDVVLSNKSVVLDAKLKYFLIYDITIKDFYDRYFKEHIEKNSDKAYNYWKIFKENGVQYDNEKPTINITNTDKNFIIVNNNNSNVSLKIFDNVKVSKLEFWINRKLIKTYYNPSDSVTYVIPKNILKNGRNKLAIKAYDYAGNKRTSKSDISKSFPAEDFFNASKDSDIKKINYKGIAYREPATVKYLDLIVEETEPESINPNSNNTLLSFSTLEQSESGSEQADEEQPESSKGMLDELASQYSLSYINDISGTLAEGGTSSVNNFTVSQGNDYGLLIDDTLGNFEITLTDPNGNVYLNTQDAEEPLTGSESSDQVILNMGSSGFMLFNPTPGEWTYSIKNRETESDYHIGIYSKLSAPKIHNEEALLTIQDGSTVELKGSAVIDSQIKVVTGSAIQVVSGSAISAVSGSSISIKLTGETSGKVIEDVIPNTGEFSYVYHDLPDDHYNLELYVTAADGTIGWKKISEIIVDSRTPDLQLEDDYEYYVYADLAEIEGIAHNSSNITAFLNGEEIDVHGTGDESGTIRFGTGPMKLKLGDNHLKLIAETETGKTAVKELVLHSEPKEVCFTDAHQPVIASVLINGKEDTVVSTKSDIEVKLTDHDTSNYKVYAICDDEKYDFTPDGDHFSLQFMPKGGRNGNYQMSIYVVSKWQMADFRDIDLTVKGGNSGFYIIKQPDDFYIAKGEKASLNLNEIFDGVDYKIETDMGTIKNGIWSFTPTKEGVYEINLKAYDSEEEEYISFLVVTDEADGFNLSLDSNGGNIEENELFVFYGESYGELPTPERTGYTFLGWFTEKDAGTRRDASDIVKQNDSRVLYAPWKAKVPTVKFDANGGNVTQSTKNVTNGSTYGTLPTPTRTGYTFAGWFTQATGGIQIISSSTVDITDEQTLYAHWSQGSYKVIFYANGGSVTPSSKNVVKGSMYGDLPIPVRANYMFDGWYTQASGGSEITEKSIVTISSSQILYAHWKKAEYEIKFDANGGSVTQDSMTVNGGGTYGTMPSPSRENYTFQGWYTDRTGGILILPSSTVNITANQTLYAHWNGNKYQVNLDANGGLIAGKSDESIDVNYGDEYGSALTAKAVKDGYEFAGWYTQKDGGTEVKASDIVRITEKQTLYAHWRVNHFTVSFNACGGIVSISDKTVINGNEYGFLPIPTKRDYSFKGWYTKENGGERILSDTIVNLTMDQTLYARWTGNTYQAKLDANGGEVSVPYIEVDFGSTYGTIPVPVRKNYIFTGWYTQAQGGTLVSEDSIVDIKADHTLYAHWKGKSYPITFDANGGSVSVSQKDVIFGSSYGALPIPQRENYTFKGWFTEVNGVIEITENSEVVQADSHTLHAVWIGNLYKVSLNANGGNLSVDSLNLHYGDAYGLLPIPTKTGYKFAGWYSKAMNGTRIEETSIVNTVGDHTIYAYWVENTFPVIFDANGGVIRDGNSNLSKKTMNVIAGKAYNYNASIVKPTKTGYEFLGWYTEKIGGVKISENDLVEKTEEHTLYAHWKEASFVVYYYANGGQVFPESTIVTYGSTYGPLPTPTRKNYIFQGWYDQLYGGGLKITEESIVTIPETHSICAQWLGESRKVTFDANGGSVSQDNKIVRYGDLYGIMPIPSRKGYTFAGWYTEQANGTKINENSTVEIEEDQRLYARWTENTYQVTLEANGGYIGNTNINTKVIHVTFHKNYGTNLSNIIPSKTGYEFAGWFTEKNGGIEITENNIVDTANDHILYAHWRQGSFNVYFNANGGNVSANSKVVKYNGEYGELPTPVRANYKFLGWYDQLSEGKQITDTSIMKIPGNSTIYAHWKGETYKVTFDSNGGSEVHEKMDVTYGSTYGTLPAPTRTGYSFLGWYTQPGGGNLVTVGASVTITGDQTLYAHWNPNYYEIKFISNGNQIAKSAVFYETEFNDSTYGKKFPTLLQGGYDFMGWYTEAEGGVEYTPATINKILKDITLYAHWEAKNYNITFHAEGGNVSTPNKQITYHSNYGLLPTPVREHYNFLGWYDSPNGGSKITENTIVSIIGDHTLYARWIGESYTVTLDPNGGDMSQNSMGVIYGNTYGAIPTPTRLGYTFTGWFTQPNNGTNILPNTIVNITNDQTLYAHWTPNLYHIIFMSNGQLIGNSSVYHDGIYSGGFPTLTQAGYDFIGWYTDPNGGVEYTPSTISKILDNIVLYARWKGKTYNLSYDANGGNVATTGKTVVYNSSYGTLPVPTRAHYIFTGWYNNAASGDKITESSIVNTIGDHIIYAHWIGETYTLTFDASGGNLSQKNTKVVYGNNYGYLPQPTRSGYDFDGWYTQSGGGTLITSDKTVKITTDATFYAHWTPKSATITFDANGGTVSSSSKEVTYTEAYGTLATPTRTGYTFSGWYTEIVKGKHITTDTIVDKWENQTLYAHWNPVKVSIMFDGNGGYTPINSIELNYNESYGVLPTPTRDNYTFAGWYTSPGGGTLINENSVVSVLNTQTLYAHWTTMKFTVYFRVDGQLLDYTKVLSYGDKYGYLPTPSKSGYRFKCWYLYSAGKEITSDTIHTTSEPYVYLDAVWY